MTRRIFVVCMYVHVHFYVYVYVHFYVYVYVHFFVYVYVHLYIVTAKAELLLYPRWHVLTLTRSKCMYIHTSERLWGLCEHLENASHRKRLRDQGSWTFLLRTHAGVSKSMAVNKSFSSDFTWAMAFETSRAIWS